MIECMKAPWWICAIPVTEKEAERGTTGPVAEANDLLRWLAGDRFLDPIKAAGGQPLLPQRKRLDSLHPDSATNSFIASWLLVNTIGVTTPPQAV